ncbi:MATE family efflux transporter [Vibrio cidicii]|uniref:MATE family efflux transporter n=1 Tax=Vibrio cidicii TaxID=1763883 RepID=UPI003751DEB3
MSMNSIYLPLIRIALPIIFIQICQASLGLIDTLIAGRFDYRHLAGVGLGSNLWTPVVMLGTGVLYALLPKVSAAASRADHSAMHELYLHGRVNTLKLIVFEFGVIQLLAFLTPWLIQDAVVAEVTKQYLHYVAFAVPGFMYMVLTRFFCEGNNRFTPVILTTVILALVNLGLNISLVNGLFGLPQLGGAGCGLATAISTTLGAMIIHVLARKQLGFAFPVQLSIPDKQQSKRFFYEGLPIGIAIVIEIIALSLLAFFASSLGTKVVAAHQVAINIAIVIFMIPLALGNAATIRVAHFHARSEQHNVERTCNAAFFITLIYVILMSGLVLSALQPFANAFSHDPEVVLLISGLLVYIAAFQFADAFMIVASGLLRGAEEFIKPMLAIVLCYWMFVLPLSYAIGVKGWWFGWAGIETIWSILIIGLFAAALLLVTQTYRHHKLSRRFVTSNA